MEASNTESNIPSSTATSNTNDLKVQTPTSPDNINRLESGTKFSSFSSTSSSPDSTLDDPFLEFGIEHDESTSTITAISKRDEKTSVVQEKKTSTDPQIPKPPITPHQNSPLPSPGPGFAFQSPPMQSMERNSNSKYRIPSSVFKRNKSNAPDWSMASNESLFSIQMGGMSFTQDQINYMKSGELGLLGDPSNSCQKPGLSGELLPKPDDQKIGEKVTTGVGKSQEIVGAPPKENADDRKSNVEGRISHYSVESTSSTKSFAFPDLAGEKDRVNSVSIGGSEKLPETPKLDQQQAKTEAQPKTPPAAAEAQPKTPEAAPPVAAPQKSWLSFFPCCS